MKNVLKTLDKRALIPSRLKMQQQHQQQMELFKICFRSGMTTLIFSKEKMDDIMTESKLLEESGLLIKQIRKAMKNEAKEHKSGFVRNLLTGK